MQFDPPSRGDEVRALLSGKVGATVHLTLVNGTTLTGVLGTTTTSTPLGGHGMATLTDSNSVVWTIAYTNVVAVGV